jgi:thiamine-phosphate pyrophosphorylase
MNRDSPTGRMSDNPSRLILVAPAQPDLADFGDVLGETMAAGDIAAVILDLAGDDEQAWRRAAELLCPIAQRSGVAFLIRDRSELVRSVGADGVHETEGAAALTTAKKSLKPDHIVGAGDCTTRHAAMTLGECGPDYVFLGRLDPEEDQPATSTLVEWWTELFELPCIAMAAGDWHTVEAAAHAGADFVALRSLVWDHPDGPAAAIRQARSLIEETSGALT